MIKKICVFGLISSMAMSASVFAMANKKAEPLKDLFPASTGHSEELIAAFEKAQAKQGLDSLEKTESEERASDDDKARTSDKETSNSVTETGQLMKPKIEERTDATVK